MAVDEALFNEHKEDDFPIIRIYSWENALSFGRFQKVGKSVDLEKLEKEKFSYVRRMTGGGVLAHGGDLSYSLSLPRPFIKDRSVKESYGYLCGFLIRLYEKLGLNAGFAHCPKGRSSNICLAGNEVYDIMIDGRKMGGNAQRHTKKALFQHGTIPISFDEERLKPLFLEDSGLERAATLQRVGITLTHEELSSLLIEAFCETFNAGIVSGTLSPKEEQRTEELLKQKYAKEEWNIDAR